MENGQKRTKTRAAGRQTAEIKAAESEKTKKTNQIPEVLPYERFERFGPENLTEAELLAIIIRTGTKEKSALQLAEEVLKRARYPKEGLLGLYDMSVEDLQEIKGIGRVKAVKLKCLTELSKRLNRAKAKVGLCFTSSGQVAAYFMDLRHKKTECVVLICLDAKGQVLSEQTLSQGSATMSLISPREIFLAALQCGAVDILLVHNHPSGDPTPSASDKILTDNVRETGEKMGIPLLDHIVIGDGTYVSFKEAAWFA